MKKLLFLVAASALMLTGCNNTNKECKCNCKCPGCQCQKDTAQAAADLDMKTWHSSPRTRMATLFCSTARR